MSFAHLHWYGWVIFVLTMNSFWHDILVGGAVVIHADKIHVKPGDKLSVNSFIVTAVGIALTLYMMGA